MFTLLELLLNGFSLVLFLSGVLMTWAYGRQYVFSQKSAMSAYLDERCYGVSTLYSSAGMFITTTVILAMVPWLLVQTVGEDIWGPLAVAMDITARVVAMVTAVSVICLYNSPTRYMRNTLVVLAGVLTLAGSGWILVVYAAAAMLLNYQSFKNPQSFY